MRSQTGRENRLIGIWIFNFLYNGTAEISRRTLDFSVQIIHGLASSTDSKILEYETHEKLK